MTGVGRHCKRLPAKMLRAMRKSTLRRRPTCTKLARRRPDSRPLVKSSADNNSTSQPGSRAAAVTHDSVLCASANEVDISNDGEVRCLESDGVNGTACHVFTASRSEGHVSTERHADNTVPTLTKSNGDEVESIFNGITVVEESVDRPVPRENDVESSVGSIGNRINCFVPLSCTETNKKLSEIELQCVRMSVENDEEQIVPQWNDEIHFETVDGDDRDGGGTGRQLQNTSTPVDRQTAAVESSRRHSLRSTKNKANDPKTRVELRQVERCSVTSRDSVARKASVESTVGATEESGARDAGYNLRSRFVYRIC